METTSTDSGDNLTECCKHCESSGNTKIAITELVLTGCLAFVAGVVFILLILITIRLKREKKLCFKEKVEPFKGKWEGASQKATIQVLKKHTLERPVEADTSINIDQPGQEVIRASGKIETPDLELNEASNTETQAAVDEVIQQQECVVVVSETGANEKETTDITQQDLSADKDHRKDVTQEAETITSDIPADKKEMLSPESTFDPDHLFEKSRGSSVFEPEDLVLQNANFRISALSNI